MTRYATALAVVLLLGACSADVEPADQAATVAQDASTSKAPEPKPEPEPTVDTVGGQACDEFRILVADSQTMTDRQLDDAVRGIYQEWGRYTGAAEIADATRAMAVAVGAGDVGLREAIASMDAACSTVGR